MEYELICTKTKQLVWETGNFIRSEVSRLTSDKIQSKGKNDFVTYVDKTSEKKLVAGLQDILPEAGFITEEHTINKKGEVYNWVIDPLDGTTNFIHGVPPFAISVALMENDQVVVGVVYEVNLDECFYAWKGSKAFLNGQEIHVSAKETVADSLIATGFPYYTFGRMKPYMDTLEDLMKNSHGVRRMGSAATDLAYVACGRYDAFYEYGLHPWDVAAGVLIVQQAGGMLGDFKGGHDYIFGKEMIAANSLVFNEFSQIVGSYFSE